MAKLSASLYWLVFRLAEDCDVFEIPPELTNPLVSEEDCIVHPDVAKYLASSVPYVVLCEKLLEMEETGGRDFWAVLQCLAHCGQYVLVGDTPVTEDHLSSLNPFVVEAHVALLDAVMLAYVARRAPITAIVDCVKKFSTYNASKELPFDSEDALLLWMKKVVQTLNGHVSALASSAPVALPELFPRLTGGLMETLNDSRVLLALMTFYYPKQFPVASVTVTLADPSAVVQQSVDTFRTFCSQNVCMSALALTISDMSEAAASNKANFMVLLADIFHKSEVERRPKHIVLLAEQREVLSTILFSPPSSSVQHYQENTPAGFPVTAQSSVEPVPRLGSSASLSETTAGPDSQTRHFEAWSPTNMNTKAECCGTSTDSRQCVKSLMSVDEIPRASFEGSASQKSFYAGFSHDVMDDHYQQGKDSPSLAILPSAMLHPPSLGFPANSQQSFTLEGILSRLSPSGVPHTLPQLPSSTQNQVTSSVEGMTSSDLTLSRSSDTVVLQKLPMSSISSPICDLRPSPCFQSEDLSRCSDLPLVTHTSIPLPFQDNTHGTAELPITSWLQNSPRLSVSKGTKENTNRPVSVVVEDHSSDSRPLTCWSDVHSTDRTAREPAPATTDDTQSPLGGVLHKHLSDLRQRLQEKRKAVKEERKKLWEQVGNTLVTATEPSPNGDVAAHHGLQCFWVDSGDPEQHGGPQFSPRDTSGFSNLPDVLSTVLQTKEIAQKQGLSEQHFASDSTAPKEHKQRNTAPRPSAQTKRDQHIQSTPKQVLDRRKLPSSQPAPEKPLVSHGISEDSDCRGQVRSAMGTDQKRSVRPMSTPKSQSATAASGRAPPRMETRACPDRADEPASLTSTPSAALSRSSSCEHVPYTLTSDKRTLSSKVPLTIAGGPQPFAMPSGRSNRRIIFNAVSHCCLPGEANRETKERCLEVLSQTDAPHFLVLFRDGMKFRGLYSYYPDIEQMVKVFGIGPRIVVPSMVHKLFKYMSGAKEFQELVGARTVSISCDGMEIKKDLWQSTSKPVASRTDSNVRRA